MLVVFDNILTIVQTMPDLACQKLFFYQTIEFNGRCLNLSNLQMDALCNFFLFIGKSA